MNGNPFLAVLLCTLAVWRITHLAACEDGPFGVSFRLRRFAGSTPLGEALDCFYCLSLWVALPFALYLGEGWQETAIYLLALSGAASLLYRMTDDSNAMEREQT